MFGSVQIHNSRVYLPFLLICWKMEDEKIGVDIV